LNNYKIGDLVVLLADEKNLYQIIEVQESTTYSKGELKTNYFYTLQHIRTGRTFTSSNHNFRLYNRTIDEWLDYYNDYKALYELFGDEHYVNKMRLAFFEIEKLQTSKS
jgi:hypothetical protein